MNAAIDVPKGLEGVVADRPPSSLVDGEAGRLYYRGYPIESLAQRRFAEVMHLVVFGELPDAARLRRSRNTCGTPGACRARSPRRCASSRGTANIRWRRCRQSRPLLALEPPELSLGRTTEEEEGLVIAARLPAAIALINAALRDHPEHAYPQSRRYGERYLQLMNGRAPYGRPGRSVRMHADPAARAWLQCKHVHRTRRDVDAGAGGVGACRPQLARCTDRCTAAPIRQRLRWRMKSAIRRAPPNSSRNASRPAASSWAWAIASTGVVDPRSKIIRAMAARVAVDAEPRRLLAILSAVDEAFIEQTRKSPSRPARESRVLQRRRVPVARHPEGILHRDVSRPRVRSAGSRTSSSSAGQPPDSSFGALCRTAAPEG